jgi:ABC-2 type transport system ATP-binding protein
MVQTVDSDPRPLALCIRGLHVRYRVGRRWHDAVRALSLAVAPGEVFGFLGPNGAGKTSTIKALLGFTPPLAGELEILGMPAHCREARRAVGYVPETATYPGFLTPAELLATYGRLSGLRGIELKQRIAASLERVGLVEKRNVRIAKLSKGTQQKVGLAQAMLHSPRLLVLDEPMSGLDPLARKDLRDALLSLREDGAAIFFSSHELGEVELIADRVAVVKEGRVVATGRPRELLAGSTGSLETAFVRLIRGEVAA